MTRLRQLDSLRGLAAVAVVLFHYTWWYQLNVGPHTPGLIATFPQGKHGVDLFFVISGFVILMTLERSRSLLEFAVSRFGRLYPAYAACSAVALGVVVFGHFNPNRIDVAKALMSMTMMSQLVQWPQIDLSYWTLTYEVLFYIAAGTVYLGLGVKRIEYPCIAWLAVSLAGRLAHLANNTHRSDVLLDFTFANLFVAGMMIHRISAGRATPPTYVTLALALALSAVPTGWFDPTPGATVAAVVMTLCFCAGVRAAASGRLAFLEWRPILFLGDISYSLYLVHQLVGFWIIYRLELAGTNPNLAIAAALAVVIAIATAVRAGVERPAQVAIRRAYVGWDTRRGRAVAARSSGQAVAPPPLRE